MRNSRSQFYALFAFLAAFPGFSDGLFFLPAEVGIQFLEDFLPCLLNVNVQVFKDAGRDTVAFSKQPQKNVFRPHVSMA